MADYRIHLLDSWGKVVRSVDIDCADDDSARATLERFAGLFPLEVWAGQRLVERYEADILP